MSTRTWLRFAFFCVPSFFLTVTSLAQEGMGSPTGVSRLRPNALSPTFGATTRAFKYLYNSGTIWVGQTNTTCKFLELAIQNPTSTSQNFRVEWTKSDGTALQTAVTFSLPPNAFSEFDAGSFGTTACTATGTGVSLTLYSTTNAIAPFLYFSPGLFDRAYEPGNLVLPPGAWQRSVITSSFSFGSSAGVCATTPENSIKVSAANVFPGSPVLGDFGWQNSGTASNSDTCSGSAFADLFLRSSANISGSGKWTFVYQVPNGPYDVTVLYNTAATTAGDTTITLNGRPIVNAVTTAASNLAQVNDRVNVGGNQILLGVSSATGTAVLNGVIVTPVAQ